LEREIQAVSAPLSRIVDIADRLFPFEEAETWDNCGLQIGDPQRLIRSVAFSLDPTPETVRFAADRSCDLLITHHPLLLEPVRSILADRFIGRTIMDAVRMRVDILSLHTNLDAAAGGLNDELASLLGLEDVIVPEPARCARLGSLPVPAKVSDVGGKVARDLRIAEVRIVSREDTEVRRIFIAAGSGMGYFEEAMSHAADLMLTGDVRYHAAREALEMGMPIIDAGHFGLERIAVGLLGASFRAEFDKLGIEVDCIECDLEMEPFAPVS